MTAPPREPVAITEIDRVIERLQMDIDDGGRPDMWSMQSMQECLRKARAALAATAPSAEPPAQAATDADGLYGKLVPARIQAYLTGGGLFNPELANHDAVRNLIIDSRELIQQQAREIAALSKGRSEWHKAWIGMEQRAERAEAERDALRAVIERAANVMHGDGVMDQGQAWDECVRVLDAARAKVKS